METAGSGSSSDREPLAGLVERVTFHNADSGFCVLRIKARGHRDLVTVLGAAPSISAGEYIQASGFAESGKSEGPVIDMRMNDIEVVGVLVHVREHWELQESPETPACPPGAALADTPGAVWRWSARRLRRTA
jgi:hypothetical protein